MLSIMSQNIADCAGCDRSKVVDRSVKSQQGHRRHFSMYNATVIRQVRKQSVLCQAV